MPSLTSSRQIRRYPQVGFSLLGGSRRYPRALSRRTHEVRMLTGWESAPHGSDGVDVMYRFRELVRAVTSRTSV